MSPTDIVAIVALTIYAIVWRRAPALGASAPQSARAAPTP